MNTEEVKRIKYTVLTMFRIALEEDSRNVFTVRQVIEVLESVLDNAEKLVKKEN